MWHVGLKKLKRTLMFLIISLILDYRPILNFVNLVDLNGVSIMTPCISQSLLLNLCQFILSVFDIFPYTLLTIEAWCHNNSLWLLNFFFIRRNKTKAVYCRGYICLFKLLFIFYCDCHSITFLLLEINFISVNRFVFVYSLSLKPLFFFILPDQLEGSGKTFHMKPCPIFFLHAFPSDIIVSFSVDYFLVSDSICYSFFCSFYLPLKHSLSLNNL